MMVVVLLLHVNCFAQYALCGLNLGYKRSERPALGVGICLSIAIAAPAIACLYSTVSPLGKEYDPEVDVEVEDQILDGSTIHHSCRRKSLEKRFSFASRNKEKIVEYAPSWRGGLFDIWDNTEVAYLSLFCSFCVLGWNMDRLGFGNMYVHTATFLLLCTAPFWVFNLAAINIDNDMVREALGSTGIILCVFGLLYGGFWRMQMRKRFNLPANNICCGRPAIADCAQWLFCCWCSLAQEVRTADFYDVVEDKLCKKQRDQNGQILLNHDGAVPSPVWSSPRFSALATEKSTSSGSVLKEQKWFSSEDADSVMKPPVHSWMNREDNTDPKT
ncbi:hypothetical protein SLE2022_073380 [Rubroshorea leprosula]